MLYLAAPVTAPQVILAVTGKVSMFSPKFPKIGLGRDSSPSTLTAVTMKPYAVSEVVPAGGDPERVVEKVAIIGLAIFDPMETRLRVQTQCCVRVRFRG